MGTKREAYQKSRDALLAQITAQLSEDERFVAAWLTGSIARNESDSLSDIDLSVVVADAHSPSLCTRLEQVSARTSPERYTLFRQFGEPALIHENNNNAPEGGTFTAVMYAQSALRIDWILVHQSKAIRPIQSRLLFERIFIPLATSPEPEDLEQNRKYVAEQWAFFWLMIVTTIKYIHRGDGVFAAEWIEYFHRLIHEMERRMNREPWKYVRGSRSQLQPTREKQLESIRELCARMLALKPRVTEFIGSEPMTPALEVEKLFLLSHDATHQS
jgi:predicted nucleotidyltransferase